MQGHLILNLKQSTMVEVSTQHVSVIVMRLVRINVSICVSHVRKNAPNVYLMMMMSALMKHKSIQYKKLTAFRSTLKMWFSIGRVKE
jgi:hypothetical protein